MKIDENRSHNYQKFDSLKIPEGILTAWQSSQAIDKSWDAFLNSSPFGHFFQTSAWAKVREMDGWQPHIIVITLDDDLIGGFQILWQRKSYLGKIGILLKGPVVASGDPEIMNFTVAMLQKAAKKNKIRALIIQPSDRDKNMDDRLHARGFSKSYLGSSIKDNTVAIDLRDSEDAVFKRIKRQKRQNINTALKNGLTVREGSKADIPTFFDYMVQTCKRQQVKPSPSNIDFLTKLWALLEPTGHIKLFLAQHDGVNVSALLVVPFGHTAYMWKFGWSGNCGQFRPNELLYWEIFRWAKNNGYQFADVGAISASLADASHHDQKPAQTDTQSYSRFKNEFGGEVVPLSKGYVYFPNPFIRWGYNLLMPYIASKPSLMKKIMIGE